MSVTDPLLDLFDDQRIEEIEAAKDSPVGTGERRVEVAGLEAFVGPGPISGHGVLVYDFETVPDDSRFPPPEIETSSEVPDLTWFASAKLDQIYEALEKPWPAEALIQIRESEMKAPKPRKGLLESVDKQLSKRESILGDWVKSHSVNPFKCRVVSFAWCEGMNPPRVILAKTEAEEVALLQHWWRLAGCRGRKRTGYNILGFDELVAIVRSRILGVTPTFKVDRGKYSNSQLVDVMNVLFPSSGAKGCKEVASDLGIKIPIPDVDGSKVYELVQAGKWDEVASYNLSDVFVERDIYDFCEESCAIR